jgi:dTDP-4-dehydrorhamnose 3,5-epimerase-like enzyme
MAYLIDLKTFTDKRGNLTVIEKIIPFEIKRVFYIYGVEDSTRGLHRHHKTIQAAITIQGSCEIWNQSDVNSKKELFLMNHPSKCLIINPEDFHWMKNFSKDCILMVFASEFFDPEDYIYESYDTKES